MTTAQAQWLSHIDFDWTRHTHEIWQDTDYHVHELHAPEREKLLAAVQQLKHAKSSPLGQVMLGSRGSGKTHLLGNLRQIALEQGLWFVLVDMTDVYDFWETTRQGMVDSLMQVLPDEESQLEKLLQRLLARVPQLGDPCEVLATWAELDSEAFHKAFMRWVAGSQLDRRYRKEFMRHIHTLRALFLLHSHDFTLCDASYNWLQNVTIEPEERQRLRFRHPQPQAAELVQGLSWIMSLAAPTVMAYDQLDSIVQQHHIASYGLEHTEQATEQGRVAAGIINGIGGGLMGLYDKTYHTLTVVSCLRTTWEVLEQRCVQSFQDRFDLAHIELPRLNQHTIAEQLIAARLAVAWQPHEFTPPYLTWPFKPVAFADAHAFTPRELLQRCETHKRDCLRHNRIIELERFDDSSAQAEAAPFQPDLLDQRYAALQAEAEISVLQDPAKEDDLAAEVIQTLCRCLLKEYPLPNTVDAVVDDQSEIGGRYTPLHARLRLIGDDDREQHFCFRVLQKNHALAYQARLKAAKTAAGIDQHLGFRKLVIIRDAKLPGGKTTAELNQQFTQAGGVFVRLSATEWRCAWALAALYRESPDHFEDWLTQRQPASQLALMQESGAVAALQALQTAQPGVTPVVPNPSPPPDSKETGSAPSSSSGVPPDPKPDAIPLGHQVAGGQLAQPFSLAPAVLTKHSVILAGAGSGKTVLLRRLVETVALGGTSAIVIDPANDLARLGDPWPTAPEGWLDDDPDRARRYHEQVEVLVWTPGREQGNPLYPNPLPNLAALADDSDELNIAIALVQDTLRSIVARGQSAAAINKLGVLTAALKYFAQQGRHGLDEFIHLLSDLPASAGAEISNAPQLASQMADNLRAAIQTNPLLQSNGPPLDPGQLLGVERAKPRLSVINLAALPDLPGQQRFVAQLAMSLFTWIKRHPASAESPLRGLLVLDEAKDFLPANRSTPCREPLLRLAAQARKYGLGLVLATQEPNSVDHRYIANCTTQFYGKASAPRGIEVIKNELSQRGGSGHDIARLPTGQFYVHSERLSAPVKIQVPMCWSHHPQAPLDDAGIIERAVRSRAVCCHP